MDTPDAFKRYLCSLAKKKGEEAIEIVVKRITRHRSTPQLGYYWSTVIPEFAQHEGYRRDEHYMLHDGLMHKFWPLEPDKVTKAARRRRLSLEEKNGPEPPLSHEEMGIHIEQVIIFAAERGCFIPDAEKRAAEAA